MRKNVVKIKLARHSHPALLTCLPLLSAADPFLPQTGGKSHIIHSTVDTIVKSLLMFFMSSNKSFEFEKPSLFGMYAMDMIYIYHTISRSSGKMD